MINVGIIGALGYTGEELIRYLIRHPKVKIAKLWDKQVEDKGLEISILNPRFKKQLELKVMPFKINELKNIDVVFLALPHTVSLKFVPNIIDKVDLIIDLSADYRFKDYKLYEQWYQLKHKDTKNLKQAVYGLSEIMRNEIKNAKLIANPGCYPSSVILALYPLIKEGFIKDARIIVDSKSGTSGAGRKVVPSLLFSELNENIRPYKINSHQHMPEIISFFKEKFNINLSLHFIPQVVPLTRGIISMVYLIFKAKISQDLYKVYKKYYARELFIRIYDKGAPPELKNCLFTNFCDLGYLDFLDSETFLIISCIDNLGKGASGQAIQNMNIALGLEEGLGLL